MKNLIRTCNWYNPMTAITEKGDGYELDNIIIYNESGVLIETKKGWFDNSNNNFEEGDGLEIKPSIKRKNKINFESKENFVVKSEEKSYRDIQKYTLYIYYKNVNYKYNGLTLDSLFLNLNYSILDQFNYYVVIGDRNAKSYLIEYNEELQEAMKKIDHYNFSYKGAEFQKALKTIAKYQKEYEKAKEYEKTLTVDNWQELIREYDREKLENNKNLEVEA